LNTVPDRYGRTDGQTDGRLTVASPRSVLASRSKNNKTQLHNKINKNNIKKSKSVTVNYSYKQYYKLFIKTVTILLSVV